MNENNFFFIAGSVNNYTLLFIFCEFYLVFQFDSHGKYVCGMQVPM